MSQAGGRTPQAGLFSNGIQQDNESMSMEIDSLIFHRVSFRAIQEPAPRNSISKFNELLSLKYQGAKIYIYLACVHIYTYWYDMYMHMNTGIHIKIQHMEEIVISRLKRRLACLYFFYLGILSKWNKSHSVEYHSPAQCLTWKTH